MSDVDDAARYRWLKERNPGAVLAIAWSERSACAFSDPDLAIDAARKATAPICRYCRQPDNGWSATDLARGKRFRINTLEYHCSNSFYESS